MNYSLVSVDGVQFSISLPITNIGEWLTSIVVRYLVSILTVFWLLLIFVHLLIFFFFVFFSHSHWLSAFYLLVCSSALALIIFFRFALKKRGVCPLEIFALLCFFSIFIWPLKTPFLLVFLSLCYVRPMWFKKLSSFHSSLGGSSKMRSFEIL